MKENYFTERRSCRNFKKEEIGIKELEMIIGEAGKAPTCGNMQLYSVIITRDKKKLKELAEFHYNQPAAVNAAAILTVCADFNRFTHWCDINNAKHGFNNFHSFMMAMTDAVIFCQQIVTIAELKGYGTCYLGTVTYNAEEISDYLKLPQLVVPVASIAIGIPEGECEKTERLPVEGIIHYENYKKSDDKEIKKIFHIHDSDDSNRKFIKENQKDNLAQVFSEVRYPGDLNIQLSAKFMNLLKKKGFEWK